MSTSPQKTSHDVILTKLEKNFRTFSKPVITFVDFDGTFYTAGRTMWKAPYYNRKTSHILSKNHIPLIIITGKSDWNRLEEIESATCGLKKADAIVAGAGTVIYHRDITGRLIRDIAWTKQLQESVFIAKPAPGKFYKEKWNKESIVAYITSANLSDYLRLSFEKDNDFVVRFNVKNLKMKVVNDLEKRLQLLFPHGVKILIAEKLLQRNTLDIFSGDILIVPKISGKDGAMEYLLDFYSKAVRKTLQVYCFGDASIDVAMLTLKSKPGYYILRQYGVNLRPRARKMLRQAEKENDHLTATNQEGPQVIYNVFQQLYDKHDGFSKAQNSKIRRFLYPLESLLDQIHDAKLSANDISFLGLKTVIKNIDSLYKNKQTNFFTKLQGISGYVYGNFTDVLDGIRARRSKATPENGQLVDVFCDRVKEFYQLFSRAQKRFLKNDTDGYSTLLAAISCILPSIARAQAEITGKIVLENDPLKGSMLSRTKKLFQSFFYDLAGKYTKSLDIDKKILQHNLATFHRRTLFSNFSLENVKPRDLNVFQQQSLAKWLLLIHLLQEEDFLVLQYLKKYPHLFYQYDHDFREQLKPYLKVSTRRLRETWHMEDSHLTLDNFVKIGYI